MGLFCKARYYFSPQRALAEKKRLVIFKKAHLLRNRFEGRVGFDISPRTKEFWPMNDLGCFGSFVYASMESTAASPVERLRYVRGDAPMADLNLGSC